MPYYEQSYNKHGGVGIVDILISFPLAIYPIAGLLGCMVLLFLVV
jgi:hypothetical protein